MLSADAVTPCREAVNPGRRRESITYTSVMHILDADSIHPPALDDPSFLFQVVPLLYSTDTSVSSCERNQFDVPAKKGCSIRRAHVKNMKLNIASSHHKDITDKCKLHKEADKIGFMSNCSQGGHIKGKVDRPSFCCPSSTSGSWRTMSSVKWTN